MGYRALAGFLLVICAKAQFDSGQISGFVRDPSRSIVVGASVTATNEGNGEKHRATTNSSGYYVFPNLFVGSYTIAAEAPGFKKSVQTGIKLSSAAKISVDAELAVGTVSESVEVSAAASVVQSETATVGRTVETRQIENLTMNGRNPIFLALLKPGVRGGSIGSFVPDDVTNGGFSINGGRADEYVVMIDGAVATRTRSSGSMLGAQDIDTVEEVQILTANYNAEYGRSSAGQIRFVTKSGTRSFHGDLVENFRNSALDANTWTRNHSPDPSVSGGPPPFRFNQFGYDISGPIFIPHKFNTERSKLFFLWAEEWIRRREQQTSTGTVPLPRHAQRGSQRAVEPGEHLLPPDPRSERSGHRSAVSQQYHSRQPHQSQRADVAQHLPAAGTRIPARHRQLDPDFCPLLQPPEGYFQSGLFPHGHAPPLGTRELHALRFQRAVRSPGTFSRAVVAIEPHRGRQPGQHAFTDTGQRVHLLGQLRRQGSHRCLSGLRRDVPQQHLRSELSPAVSWNQAVW
jgi:hypothetical protein